MMVLTLGTLLPSLKATILYPTPVPNRNVGTAWSGGVGHVLRMRQATNYSFGTNFSYPSQTAIPRPITNASFTTPPIHPQVLTNSNEGHFEKPIFTSDSQTSAKGVTCGSANVGFRGSFWVTNTSPSSGNNDYGGIWGIQDSYFGNNPIYFMNCYGGRDYWGADPQQYSDYTSRFNSEVAAGGPIGNMGLSQYIWNTHILRLGCDNRSSVGLVTTFGTNAEYGNIVEILPRKSAHAHLNSGVFAHPIRLDGYGRVMIGNVPESYHAKFYTGNAYLDLWTGGNVDVPAMLFEQQGLSTAALPGSLERANGRLYFTDNDRNRQPLLMSDTNFNVDASSMTCTNGIATVGINSVPFSRSGITNTLPVDLRIVGFTGISVIQTNATYKISYLLGTIIAPTDKILKPGEALYGRCCGCVTNTAL